MSNKINLNIHRAEQVIVHYCLKALKDNREPVRLYHKGTSEHLTPKELAAHLRKALQIGYPVKESEEKFTWEYQEEDAKTFWGGIASYLRMANQPKQTQEHLENLSEFAFLAKQQNCLRATTLLFGKHRRRNNPAQNSSAENVKLLFSKTFEREKWAGDVDYIDTNFPRAVRDIILGDGKKQLAYTTDQYDIAVKALFEYAVTQYLKLHTDGKTFDYENERDKARAYIDKCFREREKAA